MIFSHFDPPIRLVQAARLAGALLAEPLHLARSHGVRSVRPRQLPVRVAIGYLLLPWRLTTQWGSALQGDARARLGASESAWSDFSRISNVGVVNKVARRYFTLAFRADPQRAASNLKSLLLSGAHERWDPATAVAVANAAFAAGQEQLAREITDDARHSGLRSDDVAFAQLERLSTWFEGGQRRAPEPALPVDVRFGILDYRQPGHESTNIGDFIQTLASLGHLLRQDNLQFHGEPETTRLVQELRKFVKPERRISSRRASVQLLQVQRDASTYQELPPHLWTLVFGWYMHPNFGHYCFPLHPNIRPIFVSFHVSHTDMLTEEAKEYLRRWGPVGCRDWQTVALLQALNVPAFFTGCITTTVDTLFPNSRGQEPRRTAFVDADSFGEEGDSLTQIDPALLTNSFAVNLRRAYDRVLEFQNKYSRVVTSRLHAYLPARSVGCEVTFKPTDPQDVRFAGLSDLDQSQLEDMRAGILEKIARIVESILSDASVADVYQLWGEICQGAVDEAREYLVTKECPSPQEWAPQPQSLQELANAQGSLSRAVLVQVSELGHLELARLLRSIDRSTPPDVALVLVDESANGSAREALERLSSPRASHVLYPVEISAGGDASRAMATLLALPIAERVVIIGEHSIVNGDLTSAFSDAMQLETWTRSKVGNADGVDQIRLIAGRVKTGWEDAVRFEFDARRSALNVEGDDPSIFVDAAEREPSQSARSEIVRLVERLQLSCEDAVTVALPHPPREFARQWSVDPLLSTPSHQCPEILDLAELRHHLAR